MAIAKSMMDTKTYWHKGGCHCGAVKFEVRGPKTVVLTDCNCSACSMTGYQHLIVDAENFHLLRGADNITTYTFGSHTAKHNFCKTCGIKSFYIPRSHPEGVSVNFRCIEQSGFDNIESKAFDGQNWEKNVAALRARENTKTNGK